jgi:hypothetical protein
MRDAVKSGEEKRGEVNHRFHRLHGFLRGGIGRAADVLCPCRLLFNYDDDRRKSPLIQFRPIRVICEICG